VNIRIILFFGAWSFQIYW